MSADSKLVKVRQLLLIELKKGAFKITRDERNQAQGYIEDLAKSTALGGNCRIIVGFVVGDSIADNLANVFEVKENDVVLGTLYTTTYSQLIDTAEMRMFGLRKVLADRYVDVNDELLKQIDLLTKWKKADGTNDGLFSVHLMYIPNPLDAAPVISTSGQRLYWSNPNIVAQQGCFVMNPSETEVLEDVIAQNQHIPNMICIDIHKSLADYIKSKYVSHLNEDNIYPKFKKLADKASEEFRKGL